MKKNFLIALIASLVIIMIACVKTPAETENSGAAAGPGSPGPSGPPGSSYPTSPPPAY